MHPTRKEGSMTAQPQLTMTVAEYLEYDRHEGQKYEYLHGSVHAILEASAAHTIIAGNTFVRLYHRPCSPTRPSGLPEV